MPQLPFRDGSGAAGRFELAFSGQRHDLAGDADIYARHYGLRMARQNIEAVNQGYGLGLEYILVDRKTLSPWIPSGVGDTGKDVMVTVNEAGTGLRLTTSGLAKNIAAAAEQISAHLPDLVERVETLTGGELLPTGAHPFALASDRSTAQNPHPFVADASLWTSSSRIELPFADDQSFGRLHTAIRMVLPIIPAISASSPFIRGKRSPALSARILAALDGHTGIPELTGDGIPEVVLDQADYYRIVLEPIAMALAERGLAETVDYQAANRRVAVPSFERGTITITAADAQECVSSDAAIAEMVVAVVNAMNSGRWVSNYLQRAWHGADLKAVLADTARNGGDAVIANRDLLLMFGMMRESATAAELWRHLYQQLRSELSEAARMRIAFILDQGCLAQRILRRTGDRPTRERVVEVYQELVTCLRDDRVFE